MPKFVTAYGPKTVILTPSGGPSMTRQSDALGTSIERILASHDASMIEQARIANPGAYMDCCEATDYRSSMHKVMEAERVFMALPAVLRARFNNDPAEYLAFAQNPANFDEMVTLGMAVPQPPPEPVVNLAPSG